MTDQLSRDLVFLGMDVVWTWVHPCIFEGEGLSICALLLEAATQHRTTRISGTSPEAGWPRDKNYHEFFTILMNSLQSGSTQSLCC